MENGAGEDENVKDRMEPLFLRTDTIKNGTEGITDAAADEKPEKSVPRNAVFKGLEKEEDPPTED